MNDKTIQMNGKAVNEFSRLNSSTKLIIINLNDFIRQSGKMSLSDSIQKISMKTMDVHKAHNQKHEFRLHCKTNESCSFLALQKCQSIRKKCEKMNFLPSHKANDFSIFASAQKDYE